MTCPFNEGLCVGRKYLLLLAEAEQRYGAISALEDFPHPFKSDEIQSAGGLMKSKLTNNL